MLREPSDCSIMLRPFTAAHGYIGAVHASDRMDGGRLRHSCDRGPPAARSRGSPPDAFIPATTTRRAARMASARVAQGAGGGGGGGGGGYVRSNQDLGGAAVSPAADIKP
jgi:hypothetical protein